jgi:mitogen-activated protein kinase 1/3
MDYVDKDMFDLMHGNKQYKIGEQEITIITYNLLCAVQYLHSCKVMHRDIKPANVLIDDHCHIKICDFGMARTVPKQEVQRAGMYDFLKGLSPNSSSNKNRNLSPHVCSRWYRPPEVLL